MSSTKKSPVILDTCIYTTYVPMRVQGMCCVGLHVMLPFPHSFYRGLSENMAPHSISGFQKIISLII